MSTYFTPLAISINVDSFEHLEFETRPDQLLVYTLVQGDERVVIEFAPSAEDDEPSPFAPQAARVRHQRVRPDGAARPGAATRTSSAERAAAGGGGLGRGRSGCADGASAPTAAPRESERAEGGAGHRGWSAIAQLLQVR